MNKNWELGAECNFMSIWYVKQLTTVNNFVLTLLSQIKFLNIECSL